ncbi:sensor histidine kinase [Oxalobacteraceae bacterium A2-2]
MRARPGPAPAWRNWRAWLAWPFSRLYFRIYLALLAALLLFALAVGLMWQRTGGPLGRVDMTMARLVQHGIAPAGAPAAEQEAALLRLAITIRADLSLYDRDWRLVASIGPPLRPARWGGARYAWAPFSATYLRLPDGRRLLSSEPLGYGRPRALLHTVLLLLAAAIAIIAYPLVRYLTGRLERLQRGVESLGAGDLSVRVAVEGKDEIGQLAHSFNRAADRIEQLMRSHKTLLANASHELRTPLARIRLALELSEDELSPRRKAGLEQDIAELDQLLDEILLASRLDARHESMVQEEIDLLALAAEECAHYDDAVLDGVPATVLGDARLLRRLLRNLLENARRHGAPPVHVLIERAGAEVRLTVWDGGSGIPRDEFERIFEPFYRRRRTRDNDGAGLGLALVRQIARRHGGDAVCVPAPEGRSRFIITLPAR